MFIAALTAAALAGVPEGDLVLTHAQLEGTNLRYSLNDASWQGLVVRDAPATLAVFQGQELLWSAPLNNQSGTIQLPARPRGDQAISVQLFALRGAWMVRTTNGSERLVIRPKQGGQHGGKPPQGQGHHGHGHHGNHQANYISSAIEACDDAFYDANAELECVASARMVQDRDLAPLIRACDDAFYDDTNTQRCIESAAQASARHSAPPVAQMLASIQACDEALYSTAHQLSCIESTVGVWNAGPMIQSCDAAYYGEVDVIRCLQTAYLPRREEESEVVNRSHQRPAHPRG